MPLRHLILGLALLGCTVGLSACGEADRPPREFFGIAPQTGLTDRDAEYMRAGGIGSVRSQLTWAGVHSDPEGELDWATFFDPVVAVAARHGLRVLPFVTGTPEWLGEPKSLPVDSEREREAWRSFMRAAVERYGPGGDFWEEHAEGSREPLPETPIRSWQIWNEPNFFYFAEPVSAQRYARLIQETDRALSAADPEAEIVLGGLFADPAEEPPQALDAPEFLDRLYAAREGIAAEFDAVALHPYARDTARLEELVEEVRETAVANGDADASLYIDEMGWGSESGSEVSFEVGLEGQARELADAYDYLTANRDDLNLEAVYWFTWKDLRGSCNFCDSAGLFEEGEGFEPKPAWEAFVEASGGSLEP